LVINNVPTVVKSSMLAGVTGDWRGSSIWGGGGTKCHLLFIIDVKKRSRKNKKNVKKRKKMWTK